MGDIAVMSIDVFCNALFCRRILLDTSDPNKPDYIAALEKLLGELGVRIDKVLLSHWHHDHVGGAAAIAAHRGVTTEGITHTRGQGRVTSHFETLDDNMIST